MKKKIQKKKKKKKSFSFKLCVYEVMKRNGIICQKIFFMLENKASKSRKKASELDQFIKALAGKEKFSKFSLVLHQSKNDRRKKNTVLS